MIGRTTRLALVIFGGLLVVCAAFFGGLFLLLSQGPISLAFVKAPFERMINANTGDITVQIRDAVIERSESGSGFHFRLRGVQLRDARGAVVARAPRAAIGISATALLSGGFSPSRLELIGPRINLTRDEDGSLKLGFDEKDQPDDAGPGAAVIADDDSREEPASAAGLVQMILGALADGRGSTGATALLEQIAIRDAEIALYDENNDALWFAPKANLDFNRVSEGVLFSASMTVESGKLPWQLQVEARYRKQTDDFSAVATVRDFVPAEVAGKLSILSNLAEVRLPLSGRVAVGLDRKGAITAAVAQFGAGAGYVGFPGVISDAILIDEGEVNLRFDPASASIVLSDSRIYVGEAQATLDGRFKPVIEDNVLKALDFDLQVKDGSGTGALLIDRLVLGGVADMVDRRIEITRFAIEAGDARIVAAGRITEGKDAPGLIVRGKVSKLPVELLKKIWPPLAAPGARRWTVENVSDGVITEADVKIDLTSQALWDGLNDRPIANELIDVTFSYTGATVHYFGELPSIRDASGTAHLRGDEFELMLEDGRVNVTKSDVLGVSKGRFFVNDFARKGSVCQITGIVTGASEAALRVLDSRPLQYMTKFGLDPKAVGGAAAISIAMQFPLLKNLPLESVGLKARARLTRLKLANVFRQAGIEDGDVTLDVTTKGLVGSGDVVIAGVPARLQWNERFESKAGRSSTVTVEASMDDKQRARLGIDLSEFLTGPVSVKLTASGKGREIRDAQVEADLSSAMLYYRPIGWVYPSTKNASASFDLEFGADFIRLHEIEVRGPGLQIEGAVRVDNAGRLLAIDLPNANLGSSSKLTLKGKRDADDVLRLSVNAATFDARPLLKSKIRRAGDEPSAGPAAASNIVEVKGAVAAAEAFNGEAFANVSFSLRANGDVVETLTANGNLGARGTFKVSIVPGDGGVRLLRVDASNAGRVLRAVDLYSKIAGGDFRLNLDMPPPGSSAPRTGELKLKRFTVRNEQALRRIPLDARRDGLAPRNAASSDFSFSSLLVPFVIKDDVLEISQALLKGSAIGASAQGIVDTRTDSIELGGTLIPAYELNSFISHVPLVGDVLAGGKGQGIFGVTFAVTGTTEQPRIQINPVSALMPGIFRKMFEFGGVPQSGQSGSGDQSPFDEPGSFR